MTDTSSDASEKLATLFADSTPGERVRMATSMFGFAKRLAIAGIRMGSPDLDEGGVRSALLERLHGDVLGESERGRVLSAMARGEARG